MTVDFATRTEIEVVADALMALVRARVLSADQLPDAARAVGVSLFDLRDADARFELHHYSPPKRRLSIEGGPPVSAPSPSSRPVRSSSMPGYDPAVDDESDDRQYCCDCHRYLDLTEFDPDRATCRACRADYAARVAAQREAQESARRRLLAPMVEKVTMRVSADGLGLDVVCVRCGGPFEAGQVVCGELWHETCPE